MVRIVAKISVNPGMEEEFKATAKELVELSQKEIGNESYTLNVSKENDRNFVFVEVWKDQGAVASHMASPHFTRIFPKLTAMAVERPVVEMLNEVVF